MLQVIITLLLVAFAYGEPAQAPYPPSGYKPEGEPFTLPPNRFTQNQGNQNFGYQQPQTQYGAPQEPQTQYGVPEPQTEYGAPNREYLPPNQPEDNQRVTNAIGQNNGLQYSNRGDIPYSQRQNSQDRFQQNLNFNQPERLQGQRNQNQQQFSRLPNQFGGSNKANQAFVGDGRELSTGYGAPAQENQSGPAQSYGPPSSTQRPFVRTRKPSRNPESTTTPDRQQAPPATVTPLDTEVSTHLHLHQTKNQCKCVLNSIDYKTLP